MDDGGDSSCEKDADKEPHGKETSQESGNSLSLSLTPPVFNEEQKDGSESISEHVVSNNSIENDRSFNEIEILHETSLLTPPPAEESALPDIYNTTAKTNVPVNVSLEESHEERPLEVSVNSDSSIISLNFLERIRSLDIGDSSKSILEELLTSETLKSEHNLSDSKEASLNIFANVDLDDVSLSNRKCSTATSKSTKHNSLDNTDINKPDPTQLEKSMKSLEDMVALKEYTIAALTAELDSYKEGSTTNTESLSTTQYKQLHEECHNKLLEYDSAVIYKNDLIKQLTESLDQSVAERRELLDQICVFKGEIASLQKQVQEATKLVAQHKCLFEAPDSETKTAKVECTIDLEEALSDFKNNLSDEMFTDLISKIEDYVNQQINDCKMKLQTELDALREQNISDKEEYEGEISRLRDLVANIKCGSSEIMEIKNELEALHSKEVEELRTYFEKKCADLEKKTYFEKEVYHPKNYSEEVFSQQSRKMSGSSCSEVELNSDMYLNIPGPSGDANYNIQPNITKKDVVNLRNELSSLLDRLSKYHLENIPDEDMDKLKTEIRSSNLSNLLKYDLNVIRNDLQNKYHAELEVLREENENKVDELRIKYEEKLRNLEEKYLVEISDLRFQLDEMTKQNINMSTAVQEVGSVGDFEINEVIQSYERRLQEQVTLAKIDIISALENQIQHLAQSDIDNDEWPHELLQLRDKFAAKYETEIKALKQEHEEEISRMKAEHVKILNGALERARRKSLRDGEGMSKGDMELLKDRESLKKQVSSLRHLLGELLKYFSKCEDELNNTLVDELLKQGFDKNLTQIEEELNLSTNSSSKTDTSGNITRVHMTPNFNELINIIDSSSQEGSKDISLDLKNELGNCLEKLKQEANAILALTTDMKKQGDGIEIVKDSTFEDKMNSLARQLITENQAKDHLEEQLQEATRYIESLEKERCSLEVQLKEVLATKNALEADLVQTKNKLVELIENSRKEVVSEGYGEEGVLNSSGDTEAKLSELQERARSMLTESRSSADPSLLRLIEELCEVSERIREESKSEKRDLLLQIEVADKKYRTTQKFLEEQATEREQERDEAQKSIDALHEQLRDRDKDKMSCEMATSEMCDVCGRDPRRTTLQVERLESHIQQLTHVLTVQAQKCKEIESERNEAVDKIKILRDIIRGLEVQIEEKIKEVNELEHTVKRLEELLEQNEITDDGKKESSSEIQAAEQELRRHVEYLENELQQLRVFAELAGSEGALKKIKSELNELDNQLDKKTKVLELLHSTENLNCSSPSEDLSARDIPRSKSSANMDDCEVPLQQLARLKEKLIRHSRAEDAAIKRIRDLEMQVFNLKHDLEELTNERDYMKNQMQEQLVLISDFQIRLDEQRIRAEHIEKQTNTSLEMQIFDLQNENAALREKLQNKEKAYNNEHSSLLETQLRLKKVEAELNSPKEDELIVAMQRELEMLRMENEQLKDKINKEAQVVPCLVGNIISDKNTDIEKLREKLDESEKQLQSYTALNLNQNDIKTLSNLKNKGTTLEQIISFLDTTYPEQVRKEYLHQDSSDTSNILTHRKQEDVTPEPEISAISPFIIGNLKNSTEVSQKKVHFEDPEVEKLRNEISSLKLSVEEKDKVIQEYEERLKLLQDLEGKIELLQTALEETEKNLASATETFEKEQKQLLDKQKDLGVQLAEKKLEIEELQKKVEMLEIDSNRKDEMCLKLTKEKKELEHNMTAVKKDNLNNVNTVINQKNDEIEEMKEQFSDIENNLKKELSRKTLEVISLQSQVANLQNGMDILREANKSLEDTLKISNSDKAKLDKELQIKANNIEELFTEVSSLKEKINRKRKLIRDLEEIVEKNKMTVPCLEQQVENLRSVLSEKSDRLHLLNVDLQAEMAEKNMRIEELEKANAHLLRVIHEKEKITSQMAEDSDRLHQNLMNIKNKIEEPGNIIELGSKLREEQRKNAELLQRIHELKAQLLRYKNDISSVDDVTDQIKRELDYSAQIDTNILTAVSDQSLSSISESQDAEIYKKALSKERSSKKQLISEMNKLQVKLTEIETVLERERADLKHTQAEDAKLIEQLRIQLDVALDNGESLQKELERKQERLSSLEKELENLNSNYRLLPAKEAQELCELKKENTALRDERKRLMDEVTSLNQARLQAENDVKHTKDILTIELLRSKNLEEKIQELLVAEIKHKDELLTQEMLITKMTYEKDNLVKQKAELMEYLKSRLVVPPSPVQAPAMDALLKEANSFLIENRRLVEYIEKLNAERKDLEAEIVRLKGQSGTRERQQPVDDLVARCDYLFGKTLKLESIRKSLIWQKRYLSKYVLCHQQHCFLSSNGDAIPGSYKARNEFCNRLSPTNRFRSAAIVVIAIHRMKYMVQRWRTGTRIAHKINNRHYQRVLEPVTNVTSATGPPLGLPSLRPVPAPPGFQFQVGQPVSSQLFSALPAGSARPTSTIPLYNDHIDAAGAIRAEASDGIRGNDALPRSGNSPPSKEATGVFRIGSLALTRDNMNPLRAPQLIAEFAERINRINSSNI